MKKIIYGIIKDANNDNIRYDFDDDCKPVYLYEAETKLKGYCKSKGYTYIGVYYQFNNLE